MKKVNIQPKKQAKKLSNKLASLVVEYAIYTMAGLWLSSKVSGIDNKWSLVIGAVVIVGMIYIKSKTSQDAK